MTNGSSDWRTGLGENVTHVLGIHDDYVDALDDWNDWSSDRSGKISLWNTIHGLLIRAVEQDWDQKTGMPGLSDLINAMAFSKHVDMTDAQLDNITDTDMFGSMMYTAGFGSDASIKELIDQLWKYETEEERIEQSNAAYPDEESKKIDQFVRFGWELAGRRAIVEYHAQQLRVHLQEEVPLERYDPIDVSKLSQNEYRRQLYANENIFIAESKRPSYGGTSKFWGEFAQIGDFQTQIRVMSDLTSRLSESNLGTRLLTELVNGEYDAGHVYDNFRPEQLFEPELLNRVSSVVKEGGQDEVFTSGGKLKGLNQHTVELGFLAYQLAPGYAQAMATSEDASGLRSMESAVKTCLSPFVDANSVEAGTLAKVENNAHQKADVLKFAEGVADKGFGGLSTAVVEDAKNKMDLGGPNDDMARKMAARLGGDNADDLAPKFRVAAEAYNRTLLLWKSVKGVYAGVLLVGKWNDGEEFSLEDAKTVLDLNNVGQLVEGFRNDPIDWDNSRMSRNLNDVKPPSKVNPEKMTEVIKSSGAVLRHGELPQAMLGDADGKLSKLESMINRVETSLNQAPSQSAWAEDPKATRSLAEAKDAAQKARSTLDEFRSLSPGDVLGSDGAADTNPRRVADEMSAAAAKLDEALGHVGAAGDPPQHVRTSRVDNVLSRAYDTSDIDELASYAGRLGEDIDTARGLSIADYVDTLGMNYDEATRRLDDLDDLASRYDGEGVTSSVDDLRSTVDNFNDVSTTTKTLRRFSWTKLLGVMAAGADIVEVVIHAQRGWAEVEDHDYSVAAGHALAGIGTAALTVTSVGGPVFWIAIGVVVGGLALISFTQDTAIESWLQYTYFGLYQDEITEKEIDHLAGAWGLALVGEMQNANVYNRHGDLRPAFDPTKGEKQRGKLETAVATKATNYWNRQLAGYFNLSHPFNFKTAKLGENSSTGLPQLIIDLDNVQSMSYGSVFLVQPWVLEPHTDRANEWVLCPPLKFPIGSNMETHHEYKTTQATYGVHGVKQVGTRTIWQSKTKNTEAGFANAKNDPHTIYKAQLHKTGDELDGIKLTIELNQRWIAETFLDTMTAQSGMANTGVSLPSNMSGFKSMTGIHPLNDLLQYNNTNVTESEIVASESGNSLLGLPELAIEVYHVPAGLRAAVERAGQFGGFDIVEMQHLAKMNPYAPRQRKRVNTSGYNRTWKTVFGGN
jgi:hypothetical protein